MTAPNPLAAVRLRAGNATPQNVQLYALPVQALALTNVFLKPVDNSANVWLVSLSQGSRIFQSLADDGLALGDASSNNLDTLELVSESISVSNTPSGSLIIYNPKVESALVTGGGDAQIALHLNCNEALGLVAAQDAFVVVLEIIAQGSIIGAITTSSLIVESLRGENTGTQASAASGLVIIKAREDSVTIAEAEDAQTALIGLAVESIGASQDSDAKAIVGGDVEETMGVSAIDQALAGGAALVSDSMVVTDTTDATTSGGGMTNALKYVTQWSDPGS